MKKIITIILGIVFLNNLIFSQEVKKNKLWIDTNVGAYVSLFKSTGATSDLGIYYFHKDIIFSLKYRKYAEIQDFTGFKDPWEFLDDYGCYIGKFYSERFIRLNGNIGGGIISGIQRGKFIKRSSGIITTNYYEKDNILVPTLLFNLKLLIKFSRYFGMSINTSANFNTKNTIVAATIGLDARIF